MMKKFFTLLLTLTATLTAWSDGTYIDGIYYILAGDSAEVTHMGGSPYSGSVTIPSSVTHNDTTYRVTSIGGSAFYDCSGLTSITIPNSVTSIGDWAFYRCTGLTSVTIPNSVTTIGDDAFWRCSGLTSIAIGNSVTSIGSSAFSGCTALTSITIPNSVTSIGTHAFSDCTGLTSITIPNSVTSIGSGAFSSCTGLTSPVYNEHVFAFMPASYSGAYSIPSTIESIAGCAFMNCTGLTSITIPNGVTSIGNYAFEGCTGLTSFTIPNSVTTIGDDAFSGCKGLTSITIPNSVTTIGSSAFRGCTGLTSFTIPNSVIEIDNNAFDGCKGLTSITCEATTPPTCGNECFDGVYKSIPLYVPAGSISLYRAAYGWKDFTNIKAIGATDTTLSVNQPQVTPGSTDVTITWPKDSQADTYTITITKNGETVCTLTFNAQGQLTNIAFAPARGASQGNQAAQTVNGYQFTVTGLEAGTNYNYTVTTSANGTTLSTQSGSFTTKTTALTDIQAPNTAADGKYFLNGHLYIQKAGHLYTPAGHQLK